MNITPEFWINFWPNFLANFASDFLVGIVIVGVISAILKKAKKIEAKVTARLEKENDSRFKLIFALLNTGKTQFKTQEIYYHIYIPSSLSPSEYGEETTSTFVKTEEGGYIIFTGLLASPCFPGRSTALIDLRITPKEPQPNNVLYFLSTAHGVFPKGIKLDESKGVEFKKLGKVAIETA